MTAKNYKFSWDDDVDYCGNLISNIVETELRELRATMIAAGVSEDDPKVAALTLVRKMFLAPGEE